MRAILAGLLLALLPSPVFAQCACNCVAGQAVLTCPAGAIMQPVCRKLCVDRVDQTLSMPSVAPQGLGGALGSEFGGTSPQNAPASDKLQGLFNQ